MVRMRPSLPLKVLSALTESFRGAVWTGCLLVPIAHGELSAFKEFSMLVSESAQAPPAGVVGPVQPTEVRLRARVLFDLPSSSSSVDLASGKGMGEDGDSVVSILPVADRTLIRIVTFIYANNPNLVIFFHLSLRSAGSELLFRVYPSRAVSSAFPSLSHGFSGFEFWSVKLRGARVGGGFALRLGHPPGSLRSDFRCSLGVSLIVRSYRVLLSLLCFLWLLSLLFRGAELEHYRSPYLALRLHHP